MGKTSDFLLAIGIGLGVAIAAGLAVFIPVLGVVVVLIPAPFILLALRRTYWTGIVGLLVFCLVYTVIGGPLVGGLLLLLTVFLVAGVPVILRQKRSYLEYLSYSAGLVLVSLLSIMGGYAIIAGESLFTAIVAAAERFLTENQSFFTPLLETYKQVGFIDPDATASDFVAMVVGQLQEMRAFVPAILITISALAGALNLMIPLRLAARKGASVPAIPPFSRWRLPRGTFLGFFILGALSYVLMLVNSNMGQTVLYTVSSLFLFIYSVQGLCLVAYLMDRSKMPGALKVILCLLIFVFLSTLLFFIGVLEQFLHIREQLERMKER